MENYNYTLTTSTKYEDDELGIDIRQKSLTTEELDILLKEIKHQIENNNEIDIIYKSEKNITLKHTINGK